MNPQAYMVEAVRLLIVVFCAGVVLFALEMGKPEDDARGWCDVHHATDCYDRLAVRK